MKKSIRRLPDAELEVMQAVWACDVPVTRKDIEEHLKGTYEIAEAADGTQTITISVADKSEGDAKSILGTQSFSEGKDANGNDTITVGLFTFTKTK